MEQRIKSFHIGAFEFRLEKVAYLTLGELDSEPIGRIGCDPAARLTVDGRTALLFDHRLRRESLSRVELWAPVEAGEGGPDCTLIMCDARGGQYQTPEFSGLADLVASLTPPPVKFSISA